ncbi:hypothetical protein B0H21DRAFT_699140 [Amylocystis lapponica]|nr:hypothetical protein B0H21DRAFT_699140 [Amylocystis lapponica]
MLTKTVHAGRPCDEHGNYLPRGTPPPPIPEQAPNDWFPYNSQVQFEAAELMYKQAKLSASNIDILLRLWAATLYKYHDCAPFEDTKDLHHHIDNTLVGDVKWQSFQMSYNGPRPDGDAPTWMSAAHEFHFRDPDLLIQKLVSNPDFKGEIDYAIMRQFEPEAPHQRHLQDFMGGDWTWKQGNIIAEDPNTHGSCFVPIILGSDKTTVSVATGQNEYYPIYISIGNVHNNVRRAHRNAVALLGFLAIPKADKRYTDDLQFRKFRRQLFHSALSRILQSLKPSMMTPKVMRCADGHFRRVIYGLGPYIADYPEQALLACIVQGWCPKCTAKNSDLDGTQSGRRGRNHTDILVEEWTMDVLWHDYGIVGDIVPFTNDFPRADINELLSFDLLHQLIKGTFKDHLVDWVEQYIRSTFSSAEAKAILADIDRRIAAVPHFSRLRRFPEGRGFKQWTGDDSKALMKVYLPAIAGYVPHAMVRTIRYFLEFCYLGRCDVHTNETVAEMERILTHFHHEREIFRTCGVRNGFSLPRQHSLIHYPRMVWEFGAPNGLCSSITESRHIKAVKEPWRRSSRFNALGQMLITNQRLDKLAASRVDFKSRGMLEQTALDAAVSAFRKSHCQMTSTYPNPTFEVLEAQDNEEEVPAEPDADDDEDDIDLGPRREESVTLAKKLRREYSRSVYALADAIHQPSFPTALRRFLYAEQHPRRSHSSHLVPIERCPKVSHSDKIYVVYSAVALFYAPSDPSGIGGMRREWIRATPSWRRGPSRFDCVLLKGSSDPNVLGGFDVARIRLLFTIRFDYVHYSCALIQRYEFVADQPNRDTGMWIVRPRTDSDAIAVVNINSILRAAHLIPVFSAYDEDVPDDLQYYHSLDVYTRFYVNKFADHNSFATLS